MKPKTTYEAYRHYVWPEHLKGWERVGCFTNLKTARIWMLNEKKNLHRSKLYKVTRTEIK